MNRRLALGAGALIAFVGYIALAPVTTTKPATSTKVCDLTIFSPAHQVTLGSGASLNVAMSGRALRCPTGTVKISAAVDGGAPSTLATVGVDGGAWSYTATLGDRTYVVLTASMDGGGVMSSDHVTVIADSRNPTLALATPVLTGSGALVVVSGEVEAGLSVNRNVKAGVPGFYADANTDAGGGQVNLDLTITGANPGTLTVSQDSTAKITYSIASSPAHLTVTQLGVLNLDEGWTGALNFNVTGPNGATALVVPTKVKTTRPPAPVALLGVALPDGGYGDPQDGGCWSHVVNSRHADLDFCFYVPDGGDPSSNVELVVGNSTTLALTPVSTSPTATTSAAAVDTSPDANRFSEAVSDNRSGNDPMPTNSIWCTLNDPSVTTSTGTKLSHCVENGFGGWQCGFNTLTVGSAAHPLTSSDQVYCITDSSTAAVGVVQNRMQHIDNSTVDTPGMFRHFDPNDPRGIHW